MKNFSFLLLFFPLVMNAQTPSINWSEHVAPIVYKHCTSCHRPGEVAPFSLTNYQEARAWGAMMSYVTEIRFMPPWKPDPSFGAEYLQENYLSEAQINTIRDWVAVGMPEGNPDLAPELPVFPTGSQVGTPDLVLSFAQKHTHPGIGEDVYRYFVLPTGLAVGKNLVALEMRPGNPAIVHHALMWADDTGTAAAFDAATPEYGYVGEETNVNTLNQFGDQLPGYVPGTKPHLFTHNMAQRVPAGSDLVVQIHYAPTTVAQDDSSTFNLFFSDEIGPKRYVKSKIMLPLPNTLLNGPFIIPANQTKVFHGVWKVPEEVSMMGVSPHMHLLGTHWKVFAVTPDRDSIPLIHIPEWDFNWQGGYFFKKLIRLPKNTEIHAIAGYDNTTNNPNNGSNPPRFVTWGEGTLDEMYYLPLFYLPYQAGDEFLDLSGEQTSSIENPVFEFAKTKLYPVAPNPVTEQTKIGFTLARTQSISLEVFDLHGQLVQSLIPSKLHFAGEHIFPWNVQSLQNGVYFVAMRTSDGFVQTQKVVVLR